MKIRAFVCVALLALAGCASQNSRFAGREPIPRSEGAEEIWTRQLAKNKIGMDNWATIRAVRGNVEISGDQGKTWNRPKVGAILKENQKIRTSDNSASDLYLGDNGPVVRLREDSSLGIIRLDRQKTDDRITVDTMIDLEKGQIQGAVKKLSAESSYLVRTRAGVIQVRGTEFTATAEGAVSIISGAAVVYCNGKQFMVAAGQKYVPAGAADPGDEPVLEIPVSSEQVAAR